ncbi:hypothetical protein T265_07213 [Opisthorchis viverrini]|uniref:Uncharacterized protein n=1 Tax=Opisthorchis viverrini TaxID=6198 RepID=A0A074ZPT9_OPIVI|nr:hypothetical protein T265_07213 [Opisthorchis viverrini]KER25340.1 hypothetical protein T265_07213 [Opisthorchis viverrini]
MLNEFGPSDVRRASVPRRKSIAGCAATVMQLIRTNGPRKPSVSETIKHQNGTTISNEERIDLYAEYFEQQLSWPPAGIHLKPRGEVEPWTVNVEPPTASEVVTSISSLFTRRSGDHAVPILEGE